MYRHKKRHFVLFFVLCTLCVVVLAGCGNRMQENQPNQNQSGDTMLPETNNQAQNSRSMDNMTNGNNGTNDTNSTSNTNNMSGQENNLEQKGKELAEAIVREVAEVKDAHVILMESSAYVALDIERTANTSESAQLKEKVSSLIKEKDAKITTVYVTEDADTFTRFGEIAMDIADGKPISGFMEEIENFFTRITPTT